MSISQPIAQAPQSDPRRQISKTDLKTFFSRDGSERTIDVTNVDWVSDDGGFMILQLTPNNQATGNEYPLCLDSGNTSNLAGFRLYSGNSVPGYWTRGNGANLQTSSMAGPTLVLDMVFGKKITLGLAWDNANDTAYMYVNGQIKTLDISAQDITGSTRLNVKDRSNGGELDGTIHAFEVGNQYITPYQMGQRIKRRMDQLVLVGAGQSLELGSIITNETGGQGPYNQVVEDLETGTSKEIFYYNKAEGGSAVFKLNNSVSEYWWDEDTDVPGTMLERMFDDCDAYGIVPDYIPWSQGEQDALFLNKAGRQTEAEYKAALKKIFEAMHEKWPYAKILVKIIGRRTSGNTNVGGTQSLRNAQIELIDELSYVYRSSEQYSEELTDAVHPTDAGYLNIFDTMARQILNMEGHTQSNLAGPRVTGYSRAGTTVTVTIEHDGGTDFTPTTGIEGFRFFVDSTEVTINSAVRTDATTITLTLATDPSGSEELYYIYDLEDTMDIANVVKDNSSKTMPLQSVKIEG